MNDPIPIVVQDSHWWVPIVLTIALSGWVQFAAVYFAFRLASRHSEMVAAQQAADAAVVREDERKFVVEHAQWEARWNAYSGRVEKLDKLLKDISSWASHVQMTEAAYMSASATADLLVIQVMLRAIFPAQEAAISRTLYDPTMPIAVR